MAVLCVDDANVRAILPDVDQADRHLRPRPRRRELRAIGRRERRRAHALRRARAKGAADLAVELALAGVHNVRNALAAIAVGREAGVADAAIAKALAEFHGVGRRFQRYGDVALADGGHFTLIDDYGHHPVEMAATLAAARASFPGRRLVLAFQPHRYTRTRDLFEDFVRVLSTVRRAGARRGLSRRRGADRRGRRARAGARGARGGQGRAGVRRGHRASCRDTLRALVRDGDVRA